jgi:hypothetical protein
MPKEIEKNCGFGMAEKKLQGKTGLLWSFHVGTFRKFLFIISSRRLEVMLISELLIDWQSSTRTRDFPLGPRPSQKSPLVPL